MHKLLLRQMRKAFGSMENASQEMEAFARAVSETYVQHDADRMLLQRAMDLSSQELLEANHSLRRQAAEQALVLDKLKESIRSLNLGSAGDERPEDDLLSLVDILEEQIDLRNRAEAARQQSEAHTRAIIAATVDGIITIDEAGVIDVFNPAAERLFGYAAADVRGRSVYDLVEPPIDPVEDAGILSVEVQGRKQDGSLFPMELAVSVMGDNGHGIDGRRPGAPDLAPHGMFVLVVRDLTERKLAEEALRRSEEKYRTLVATSAAVVWMTDADGHIVTAQPSWESYTGQTWEVYRGMGWLNAIHPDDQGRLARIWLQAIDEKAVYEAEGRVWNHERGQYRHFTVTGVPLLNADGSIDEWVGTVTDVHDRIEAEQARIHRQSLEHFNKLADSVPGMLYQFLLAPDGSMSFPYVSPGVRELYGLNPEAIQDDARLVIDMIHPDDQEPFYQSIEVSAQRLEPWRWEGRSLDDGRVRWLQGVSRPERQEDGSILWNGLLMDITERKLLEAQLGQAQKLESIGQLAAGIAHEINTPIQYVGDNIHFLEDAFREVAAIVAHFEALLADARSGGLDAAAIEAAEQFLEAADFAYLAEEIPGAIRQSKEGVDHVAHIVGAMKEFSHPGVEEKIIVDLNHALETTIVIAKNEWKYVADIETDLAPDLPDVPCLPGELNQVFLNLIVNAAHAIGEALKGRTGEKGCIRISTQADDDHVEVRIRDSGSGIPERIRERIFDPFFTTKEVGKGTGQGLAIAYSVVTEKHGGTIDFETKEGEGTTFIVRLPVVLEEAPEAEALL